MPGITCATVQQQLVLGAMTTEATNTAVTVGVSATLRVRTLIVDDNIITAKMLSKILSKEFGHATATAESGKEALALLRNEVFDVIFMDIDMPELSGVETTLAIHSATSAVLEANRHVPIIAYTTNPCDRKYFEAGMNGWVGKPASQSTVRKELERVYTAGRRRLSTTAPTISTQQSC